MEEITKILSKYQHTNSAIIHDTIDELCAKGIAEGCYQDYGVLFDIISILTTCETIIKNKEDIK